MNARIVALALTITVAVAAPSLHAQAGLIYRLDSNAQSPPTAFEVYDIATNMWTVLPNLPVACTTSICSDGSQVYAMGVDGMVYTYDPVGVSWSILQAGPGAAIGQNVISMLETLNDEFYWGRDGQSTLHYTVGGVWTSAVAPASISSGSDVDRVAGLVYSRVYSQLGFIEFDPATTSFRLCSQGSGVGENSRVGVFYDGNWYSRTGSGPIEVTSISACTLASTGVTPTSRHSSMAVTPTGQIYLNGWSPDTPFDVYDIATMSTMPLASAPTYPGNGHSSLAYVGASISILSTDTAPTQVPPGGTGYAVDMVVSNDSASESFDVTGATLRFTGTADRTTEYTIIPDVLNPTVIPAGTNETFSYTVNVDSFATEENIVIDGDVAGTFQPSGQMSMANQAAIADSWDVVGARPEVRTIDAVPDMVSQGSLGNAVNFTLENVGLTDWMPGALTMSFVGSADRSSEYTVTPDPGNPPVVAAGMTETFAMTVDVSAVATVEVVTIDVAQFDGTDSVTARTQSDSGADVTDTWEVLMCNAPLCGDCNGDMMVTILDALVAAQHAAGLLVLTGTDFTNCNVIGIIEPDPMAIVDVLDALTIAQFAAGLPVTLMCC